MGFFLDKNSYEVVIDVPAKPDYPEYTINQIRCRIELPEYLDKVTVKQLIEKIYSDLMEIAKKRPWDVTNTTEENKTECSENQ